MPHPFSYKRATLGALFIAVSFAWAEHARATPEDARLPRAVIELFSSQGCSACPPANRLAAELAHDPGLIVLTLPIDYWDYLGWKDTLARPELSARQRAYAEARGDRQVYTPQMVVNGRVACVGAQREAVDKALKQASDGRQALQISVRLREKQDLLTIEVGEGLGPADLWLLPIKRNQEVTIKRGENRGHSITYVNVVRDIRRVAIWSGSPMTIEMPRSAASAVDADGFVVLLQKTEGSGLPGAILGAAQSSGLVR